MTHSIRRELLRTLEELSIACPEVRLGQLVVNLSYMARGPEPESAWDVEDDQLLAAARKQLEEFRKRHASVA